jgi:hypothetical protein
LNHEFQDVKPIIDTGLFFWLPGDSGNYEMKYQPKYYFDSMYEENHLKEYEPYEWINEPYFLKAVKYLKTIYKKE